MTNNITTKNLFIITSVINVSENELCYSKHRSLYSNSERYAQTKETIESIKRNIKEDYFIILCETSILDEKTKNELNENVDLFIDLTKNKEVFEDSSNNLNKSVSEAKQILEVLKFIEEKNIDFKYLFKISGRYRLNDSFIYENFLNESNNFKLINKKSAHTFLYKICRKYINEYKDALLSVILSCNGKKYGMEDVLFIKLSCDIKYVDNLGITGNYAPSKKKIIV